MFNRIHEKKKKNASVNEEVTMQSDCINVHMQKRKTNKQTNTQTNKQTNMSSSVSVFVFLYSGKLYRLQLKTFLLCLPQHYKMKVWKRRFFVGGLNDYFLFPHSSAIPLYLGVVTVTDFQVLVRQKMYIVLEHDDCNGDIFPFFFFLYR